MSGMISRVSKEMFARVPFAKKQAAFFLSISSALTFEILTVSPLQRSRVTRALMILLIVIICLHAKKLSIC
jgi:hypothetical protein